MKLLPPYDPKQLESIFAPELLALKELLSPALKDFGRCQSLFREEGFVADEPYRELLCTASNGVGSVCRSTLKGRNPTEISLADLIELYPNRMLQFLPDHPTPRTTYLACLGDVVLKHRKTDLEIALAATWVAFAAEANSYPEKALSAVTRKRIVEVVLKDSLAEAGFDSFPLSKASVKKWHPHPNWVDAALGAFQNEIFCIALTGETFRPRKFALLSNFAFEPDKIDTAFDTIGISFWVIPKREISDFDSAALRIKIPLFWHYRSFYSVKGLRRIVNAHVVAAKILMI